MERLFTRIRNEALSDPTVVKILRGAITLKTDLRERWQLLVVHGPREGQKLILPRKGSIGVGRASDCGHKVVGRSECRISRRHAEFQIDESGVKVRDQNSLAGTFVNGTRCEGPEPVALELGDVIELGDGIVGLMLVAERCHEQRMPLFQEPSASANGLRCA